MAATGDLTLERLSPARWPAVEPLTPTPAETRWSGGARDQVRAGERDPTRHFVVMVGPGDEPVGFFTLDWGERSRRYAPKGVIGVHGFFVDHRHRRRGHARAALQALPAFVAWDQPGARAIALTVNTENEAAIATYLAGGFRDTGRLFHGGAHGPQHVMWRDLTPDP